MPPSVSIFGTAARSPATFHPRTTCRCRRSLPSATPSPITPSCSTNAGTPPAPTHRLDRDLTGRFGSAAYAMEECTVELLSAMICADLNLNVEPRPDHARYIASWLELCSPRHNCSYPQQPIMRRKAAAPPENRRNQLLRTGFAQHYFLPDLCCRFDKQRNQ